MQEIMKNVGDDFAALYAIHSYDLESAIKQIDDVFCKREFVSDIDAFLEKKSEFDHVFDFFEIFLAQYDAEKRKSSGVWCTPKPIVDFIVRAVDQILQKEFGMPEGLGDENVHVIDPAAGTCTFFVRILELLKNQRDVGSTNSLRNGEDEKISACGATTVEDNLKDRLHGFELMPTSFILGFLRLDSALRRSSCDSIGKKRWDLRLKNSLEGEIDVL
ncbi:hypothetical protein FACS189449_05280 [Alphaproteobacteria bacterium]|nr:hypothetical protein FACS189449_05280 [Alphaproteobacteria bacterium]